MTSGGAWNPATPVIRLGAWVRESVRHLGAGSRLLGEALASGVRPPFVSLRLVLQQCRTIGVGSIPVVLVTGLFAGMVLALQSADAFARFGAQDLIGTVVSLAVVREMGPVLAGLMVAGRMGSSMAAELGTMRITEQIDALLTLATNPVRHLVLPRILAATLMLPCLVIFADFTGIVGGWIVAVQILGNNAAVYEQAALQYLTPSDISMSLVKAAVFGGILSTVSCYEGFTVSGGAREVGAAVTRSVVLSLIGILVFNYIVTAWFA